MRRPQMAPGLRSRMLPRGSQMNEFVVGVDGSDHGQMPLRSAAAADAARAPVRAVQSWAHPRSAMLPIAAVPVSADDMDEQTLEAITAVATDTLGSSAAVTADVLRGPPAGALLQTVTPRQRARARVPRARWLCRTPARLGEPGVRRVLVVPCRRGPHRPTRRQR